VVISVSPQLGRGASFEIANPRRSEAQASIRVDSSLSTFASLWAIVRLWPTALITNTFEEHPIRVTCRPSGFVFPRWPWGATAFPGKYAPAALLESPRGI
jgi:hypothetical protein